mgnify:CR=1 FL=1
MSLRKVFYLISVVLVYSSLTIAQDISTVDRVGWWKFNDTTNIVAPVPGYGLPLQLVGTHQVAQGVNSTDYAVKIGVGSHYKMRHQIPANGGGNKVNEYSLQIDFKIEALGIWHCFFQTTILNNNDGDCFINPSGNIGTQATGYSGYAVKVNEWYRMIISVKNSTHYNFYMDGQLLKTGNIQAIDDRFSLDSLLLMFADEDGEDSDIIVSEIGIWDRALSALEVSNLGGFGHQVAGPQTLQLILVPYLQMPTQTSVWVCWHDTLSSITNVEYGTTQSLGQTTSGTNELVASTYRWHSVKLTGLVPNTEYFYRAVSGTGASNIYSFKTLPDSNYTGKLRFLLLSDTHSGDTTMAVKVIKQAKLTMQQLYGNDIQNQINLVIHSGDLVVSGSDIVQWTDQYFAPMSPISPNIPFMTITGNHEGEHQNYYKYMHYDEVSPIPATNEKFWAMKVANTVFIGLNSCAVSSLGTLQKTWLDNYLMNVQADPTVDFVFVMSHHFSVTELWGEGMTYDAGPGYITNQIYPILKKYSKVVQHSYGHTHGYERGTLESQSVDTRSDFRIICGGGGGGATDRWGAFVNNDFPQIQKTFDHYFYQIVEIDVANKTYESTMYSLGNISKVRNNEIMDKWYRKDNQAAPNNPITYAPTVAVDKITFNTSQISGDSLMTVKIQISQNENFTTTLIDTMIHWSNIYGVDAVFNPIDLNEGIDLTKLSFNSSRFISGNLYYYRVKYRDHNLKWSDWSTVTSFNNVLGVDDNSFPLDYELNQNYPNPFNPSTEIKFGVKESGIVSLKVYDILGNLVKVLVDEEMNAGYYNIVFKADNLSSGVYFYKIQINNFSEVKKMMLLR